MIKMSCLAAATALACLSISGPANAKVEIVKTSSATLSKGSTFAWAPTPAVGYGIPDPAIANEITVDRLRVTTEATLAAKGYRQVGSPNQADFLVSYTVVMRPTSGPEIVASRSAPSFVRLDSSSQTEGLLVLDLTERQTGRLVWRASSKKRLTGKDVTDKSLTGLLREMTKSLPQ